VNIKIIACQIIGPAAAGSAGPVPTPLLIPAFEYWYLHRTIQYSKAFEAW